MFDGNEPHMTRRMNGSEVLRRRSPAVACGRLRRGLTLTLSTLTLFDLSNLHWTRGRASPEASIQCTCEHHSPLSCHECRVRILNDI